ncbi:MAG TPA: hypothetical protein DCF41_00280 [Arcobacter skirrowii]|nr:hypothetical protein [Aliarcobacter skirrowii]
MKIEINKNDIKNMIQSLSDIEKKQVPFATMITLNKLAFSVMEEHKKEIKSKLNWKVKTPNAIRYKKATKKNLVSEVYIDEWSWGWYALKQHYTGEDRHRKGLEKAMQYFGYMSKDEILTPPPGVKINAGRYTQIKSQLKLDYKSGYTANETINSRKRNPKSEELRYFIITRNSKWNHHPGIYARMSGYDKPICLLRISKKPKYKKRFDFEQSVHKIYSSKGRYFFSEALANAIKTAK